MDPNTEAKPSVLKNKNFFLLFQGSLTSDIAATFYSFAISFYILEITANNASVQGTYLFVCGIVYVLVSFVGGVLADRWNKAKIVYGTDFIKGALILVSLIFLHSFIRQEAAAPQLAVLFLIGIVNNVLAAVFYPASVALLPEIVDPDQLMQANSLFSLKNSLVSILGVILAALFYSLLPITALFLMVGVLYVLSGVTELFIRAAHEKKEGALTLGVVFRDFADGLKYLWGLKPILVLILGALFLNFFITPLTANLLPYILKTDVAGSNYIFRNFLDPESWSAVFTLLFGAGSILMSVLMGSRKQKGPVSRGIKFWLVVMSALFLFLATVYSVFAGKNINVFLISMCSVMLLVGVALVGINLPANVAIQQKVQKGMLAKVTSIMTIGGQGLTPFSSLIAGLLLTNFNASVLFFFCTGGLALTTAFACTSKSISKL